MWRFPQMYEWMSQCMDTWAGINDAWKNAWMYICMYEWMNVCVNKWWDACVNEWLNICVNEWSHAYVNKWWNEHMCEWMIESMHAWWASEGQLLMMVRSQSCYFSMVWPQAGCGPASGSAAWSSWEHTWKGPWETQRKTADNLAWLGPKVNSSSVFVFQVVLSLFCSLTSLCFCRPGIESRDLHIEGSGHTWFLINLDEKKSVDSTQRAQIPWAKRSH